MSEFPSPWDQAYQGALCVLNSIHSALDEATCYLDGPPAPDPERDYPDSPLPSTPELLLSHLAELWVISAPDDPRPSRIKQGARQIALKRAKPPVEIGGAFGTSVAEAALLAATRTTMHLDGNFGCGQLVRIVQAVFPRDVPGDPWELSLALTQARFEKSLGPIAKALLEKDAARSEFRRRLYTYPLAKAFEAVRLTPLCAWLRDTFKEFRWQYLRKELELEFIQAFPFPEPPKPRWEKRKLWFGETLCKWYKRRAHQQEKILDAFEEEDWPRRIDDPLDKGKLAETIKSLQEALRGKPITFERDGTGKGICWRERSPENP
jgi:hypothetical protein